VAMSFAYEPTEASVMQAPPRRLGRDSLVDRRLVLYSYGIAGTLETLCCMWAFFSIFQYHGISGSHVIFSSPPHWTSTSPDLVLGGTVYTAAQQVSIVREARSAYYATLILCQFANLWNCKTQSTSLLRYNLLRNHVSFYGVAVMGVATVIIVYVPAVNTFFGTGPLVGWAWAFWIAFALLITAYAELSKWQVRRNRSGWWARNIQW